MRLEVGMKEEPALVPEMEMETELAQEESLGFLRELKVRRKMFRRVT
jgi:hypothetical protein